MGDRDSSHHLVRYLKHVRRELRRAVEGMSQGDLEQRVQGINSVAWMVGHLSWQEQRYWLEPRGEPIIADYLAAYANGAPAMTSPQHSFAELYAVWESVTEASNPWLESLSGHDLRMHFQGRRLFEVENVGSLMTRVIGHYYLHIGQITVVRKLLGYPVPSFVGLQEAAYFE